MSDCLFCKIVAGDVPSDKVYEDEKILVFRDIAPKAEVHLLLIPKEHIESLNELSALEDSVVLHMMQQLPLLAAMAGIGDGYRTIINTGQRGGQVVFHLHIHLMGGGKLPGF
ncbi:MAG: histidine triad nucleotide-binding protein [Gammaproteobacteria bacterium]|nr:histidine triad nucleotide-binding protein [Gammaproteobacteria bacterium]